jgi:sarcosine oxidase
VKYDVAVVGLGGMGSAALAQLAHRGVRAIGIEQFARGHDLGASVGRTRIIRKAYFEHPAYVPLLQRAYDGWHALQERTGARLLDLVGILMVGAPEREGIAGTLRSAREFDLALEVLDKAQLRMHFPQLEIHGGEIGLIERDAGMVYPEVGVAAHLAVAEEDGATLRFETTIARWDRGSPHVLRCADGTAIAADRIAVTAGPWSGPLIRDLNLPLQVQRNVQIWFDPMSDDFDFGIFPTFFVDRDDFPAPLYGFPAIDGRLKAALHAYGETIVANELDRTIHDADIAAVRSALERFAPEAAGAFIEGKACMYTMTPDGHFIVDRDPNDASVVIAAGFSGHGYKFTPAIGELVADLLEERDRPDAAFLRLDRFTPV